jgi:hypothetical protein
MRTPTPFARVGPFAGRTWTNEKRAILQRIQPGVEPPREHCAASFNPPFLHRSTNRNVLQWALVAVPNTFRYMLVTAVTTAPRIQ